MTEQTEIFTSASESETAEIATGFCKRLKSPCMIALKGTLGAGKSVFTRAMIRYLSGNPALDVPSPTFTLVQYYNTTHGPLWHFDLYRLEDPEEIYELGWEDALAEGIVIVEWPERLGYLMPQDHMEIKLEEQDNRTRLISIHVHPSKHEKEL